VGAPKATPAGIVDTLNKEINAGLNDSRLKARIAEFGGSVLAQSPGEFGTFVAAEAEKWGKVIRAAGIRSE
jgi:tripartite-type tricarboxylate transporter receptor subunit TctC